MSASEAIYDLSAVFICLPVYAIGRSTTFCTCDKMAAIAILEASVVKINDTLKFRKASTEALQGLSFKLSRPPVELNPM